MGGLPSELIGYGYDGLALAQPQLLTLGTGGSGNKSVYVANTFEEGTSRLTRSHVTDQTHGYMLQDLNYTYDQAGNVTAISDPTTLGGNSSPDTQCFAYDGHQRLVEAWTPASQKCTDTPSASSLSGTAPYLTSYSYNDAGQRASETVHKSTGDTKTTHCYPTTLTDQPHALTGTTTKTDCASPERAYDYDDSGNTRHRPGANGTQTLEWSPEGLLSKLTENGVSTDYLYSADGTLLIRNTQNGERVLYAGATEFHLRANGTTWAQRYYSAGDVTAAVRSNQSGTNKVNYLTGDHRDPALYDVVQSDSTSAGMCQTLIERHRPDARTLVDFGCGTGRDLEILAKRFECIGVDLQPGMVDYAHRARPGLDIRTGDMRTARLGSRMDVVTCMGNSLAYVHDNEAISQVFATFAAHARPGALLVLCSPVAPITRPEPTIVTVDTPTGPSTVTIRHTWDLRTQINTMHRHWRLPSGDEARDEIRRRVLFPRELERYAEGAGFEVLDMLDGTGTGLTGPTAYTVARQTPR